MISISCFARRNKIKNIFAVLLIFVVFILPSSVFAAETINIDPQPDASTTFLQFLFGEVFQPFSAKMGHDTAASLFGVIFKYYNIYISVVAVIMIIYIALVGLVNTAHSGSALGQRWHSFYVPLKVVIGAASLMPLGNGYNLAQVVIYWFILTGTDIATAVWGKIQGFGVLYEGISAAPTPSTPPASTNDVNAFMSHVRSFAICLGNKREIPLDDSISNFLLQAGDCETARLKKIWKEYSKEPTCVPYSTPVSGTTSYKIPAPDQAPNAGFPSLRTFCRGVRDDAEDKGNDTKDTCEENEDFYSAMVDNVAEEYDNEIDNDTIYDLVSNQVVPLDDRAANECGALSFSICDSQKRNALNAINSTVKNIVNDIQGQLPSDPQNTTASTTFNIGCGNITAQQQQLYNELQSYQDACISSGSGGSGTGGTTATGGTYKSVQFAGEGWITAGPSYYYKIKQGQDFANDVASTYTGYAPGGGSGSDLPNQPRNTKGYVGSAANNNMLEFVNQINASCVGGSPSGGGPGSPTPVALVTNATNIEFDYPDFEPELEGGGLLVLSFFHGLIMRAANSIVEYVLNLDNMLGFDTSVNIADAKDLARVLSHDPVNSIARQGNFIMKRAELYMITALVVIASAYAAAVVGSLGTSTFLSIPWFWNGSGGGGGGFATAIMGIIFGIIVAVVMFIVSVFMIFYPLGATMNIYIPLIPMIIWLFGVMGWFLICIEAMVAAPLVAVGLMHPDGNEVLGKAEQGLMMILNLLLRPVLMVIGLVGAIYLSRIFLFIFAWFFSLVFGSNITPVESIGGIYATAFLFVGLLALFIQRAFSLINALPDKVITWIGGAGGGVGESDSFLGAANRGVEQGQAAPAAMGKAAKGGFKTGKAMGPSAGGKTGGSGPSSLS